MVKGHIYLCDREEQLRRVVDILRRRASGERLQKIATRYGVSRQRVHQIYHEQRRYYREFMYVFRKSAT